MARPQGSRNALIRVTYDVIAELAGGIGGDTARRYAHRGEYDSRDLESILRWVNGRRRRQGKQLIGLPDDAADSGFETLPPYDPWRLFLSGAEVYVSTLGQFRSIYDM